MTTQKERQMFLANNQKLSATTAQCQIIFLTLKPSGGGRR
jgi:hypothetical protein